MRPAFSNGLFKSIDAIPLESDHSSEGVVILNFEEDRLLNLNARTTYGSTRMHKYSMCFTIVFFCCNLANFNGSLFLISWLEKIEADMEERRGDGSR